MFNVGRFACFLQQRTPCLNFWQSLSIVFAVRPIQFFIIKQIGTEIPSLSQSSSNLNEFDKFLYQIISLTSRSCNTVTRVKLQFNRVWKMHAWLCGLYLQTARCKACFLSRKGSVSLFRALRVDVNIYIYTIYIFMRISGILIVPFFVFIA